MDQHVGENKKLFWKEMDKVIGGKMGCSRIKEEIRGWQLERI